LEKNDDYIYVINKFLEYDRPLDSFYIIANFKNNNQEKIPSDLYIKVLDNLIKFDFINASHSVDLFMYKLEKVLYELQKRGEISKRKLALIEWGFLPFLNYSKIPENLSTEIENDPSLFINILKLAYKKDDLTRNEKINQTITCRAHQLLSNYNILPGMSNGKFDVEHFQNWFLRARLLASNIERIQEFDSIFGLLLAYSPNDPADKSWPHKAVRDLFEKYGTEEMESSLRSRLLNKRGVFIKTIGEGGIQETEIAKVYGNYAKTSEIFWPRMGKILRQLEKNYLSYADREELTALQEDF
jgi:hypothetical protein